MSQHPIALQAISQLRWKKLAKPNHIFSHDEAFHNNNSTTRPLVDS